MKNKKQLNKIISLAIKNCFKDGKLIEKKAESMINSLKKLPTSTSIQVLSLFSKKLRIEIDKITLEIQSSSPLSNAQQNEIFKKIKKSLPVSTVKNIINPKLIAGIKLRIFDTIYDYSMDAKIKKIGEVITHG